MINTLFFANKANKPSHLVLVADSDNTFTARTKVTSMKDQNPNNPTMKVLSAKPIGNNGRYLLVRYQVDPVKAPIVKGPAGGPPDIDTGAVTITITDPPSTPIVGIGYSDD